MNNYVDKSAEANHRMLEANRCDEIIAKFTKEPDNTVNNEELTTSVTEGLAKTKAKITELAKTTNEIINDYNAYSSTVHVSPLTGVNYYASLTFSLYALIAILAGAFLSIVVALAVEIAKAVKSSEKTDKE